MPIGYGWVFATLPSGVPGSLVGGVPHVPTQETSMSALLADHLVTWTTVRHGTRDERR
jgi:hypothetical protein